MVHYPQVKEILFLTPPIPLNVHVLSPLDGGNGRPDPDPARGLSGQSALESYEFRTLSVHAQRDFGRVVPARRVPLGL